MILTGHARPGKRIVELQTSLALIQTPQANTDLTARINSDLPFRWRERKPSSPPALNNIEVLSSGSASVATRKASVLDRGRLAQLAEKFGLQNVIRWKPRQLGNLKSSGMDTVLAHTVYAIIGAVALSRGGEMATRAARSRILTPLGIVKR